MIRNQESGTWLRTPKYQREIRGLGVGIRGYGGIAPGQRDGMQVHAIVRGQVRRRGNHQVPGSSSATCLVSLLRLERPEIHVPECYRTVITL